MNVLRGPNPARPNRLSRWIIGAITAGLVLAGAEAYAQDLGSGNWPKPSGREPVRKWPVAEYNSKNEPTGKDRGFVDPLDVLQNHRKIGFDRAGRLVYFDVKGLRPIITGADYARASNVGRAGQFSGVYDPNEDSVEFDSIEILEGSQDPFAVKKHARHYQEPVFIRTQ